MGYPSVSKLPKLFSVVGIIYLGMVTLKSVSIVKAQSITSANDGTGSVVTIQENQFDISGGSLSEDGANLFHNFQEFGLDANEIANFLSTPNIQNILGRVVGGNASIIDGLIQVTGGTANLYLINPAGIIFGANAQLNVMGDFTATTATGISFGDTLWFQVLGDNHYQTLIGNPSQFAFELSPPGSLVNSGDLSVKQGQNLTLLGGTVVNTGKMTAPGGTITLAAVPGENLVRISQPGQLLSLEVKPLQDNSGNLLPVEVLDLPTLLTGTAGDVETGLNVLPTQAVQLTEAEMMIPFQSGLVLTSGIIDVSIVDINNAITSSEMRGSVNILGEKVGLVGANVNASGINGGGRVLIGGDYQGQGQVPSADRAFVSQNSTINVDGLTGRDGGQVVVWSNESTRFLGTINARGSFPHGDGGFVEVSSRENLEFAGWVDTSAFGQVGTLLLDPKTIIINATGSDLLTGNNLFNDNTTGLSTISGATLSAALDAGDVILQANTDILIEDNITGTTFGNGLTLQAGRSIKFPVSQFMTINLNSGDFIAKINDEAAIPAQRETGIARFELFTSRILTNGGDVVIEPGTFSDVGNGIVGEVEIIGATINSLDGNIQINGIGQAGGSSNRGISIRNSSQITTTGTGTISLNGSSQDGFGGMDRPANDGLFIFNQVRITSEDGDITLTGTTQASGEDNTGINIETNSIIESTGKGNIILDGTGGLGSIENEGIWIQGGSRIAVANGNINLIGKSRGSGNSNYGIFLDNSTITSTGTGMITLEGIGGDGEEGIRFSDGILQHQGSGPVILNADEINLLGTTKIDGNSMLQLQPLTPGTNISVGGTVSDASLNLDTAELNRVEDGFSQILITPASSKDAIALVGEAIFKDPVTLQAYSINYTEGSLIGEDNAAISLIADQDIITGNIINSGRGIAITSTNGTITATGILDASSGLSGNGGDITLNAFGNIATERLDTSASQEGGNITLASVTGTITTTDLINAIGGFSGGNITISATGNINTADINALLSGFTGDSGTISLTSNRGNIDTNGGALNTASALGVGGNIVLNAPVGSISIADINSRSFTSTGGEIKLNAGDKIITHGNIETNNQSLSFNQPVLLAGNTAVTILGTGEIRFNDTVDGTYNLSLFPDSRLVQLNQFVGHSTPLNNIRIQGDITTTNLAGIDISTINTIDIRGTVISPNGISLSSRDRDITTGVLNSSTFSQAGDINLEALGNIEVHQLNAQSFGNSRGGNIDVTAGQFFRVTSSFNDENTINA